MIALNVGQIIYILGNKTRNIYPGQVTSELHEKTLKGESTKYIALVDFRDNTDKQELTIDDENQEEVFVSASSLKEYLISRASDGISTMIDEVVQLAQRSFDVPNKVEVVQKQQECEAQDVKKVQTRGVGRPRKSSKVQLPGGEIVEVELPD